MIKINQSPVSSTYEGNYKHTDDKTYQFRINQFNEYLSIHWTDSHPFAHIENDFEDVEKIENEIKEQFLSQTKISQDV